MNLFCNLNKNITIVNMTYPLHKDNFSWHCLQIHNFKWCMYIILKILLYVSSICRTQTIEYIYQISLKFENENVTKTHITLKERPKVCLWIVAIDYYCYTARFFFQTRNVSCYNTNHYHSITVSLRYFGFEGFISRYTCI